MPYCQKCGTKVDEEMAFCTKCGATLEIKMSTAETKPSGHYRSEKSEKGEKREKEEKGEKTEKHEKREFGVVGPLIGGLILIFIGFMLYLAVTGYLRFQVIWPLFIIIVGVIIIVAVVYGAITAARRQPRP